MIKEKLKTALWWLRHRTTHRFHVINISGMDGYTKGWIDRDHAMYLACFKILTDFVEKEDPNVGRVTMETYTKGWTPSPEDIAMLEIQITGDAEIRALYDWWTKERPADNARRDKLAKTNFNAYCDEAARLEKKDEEMLERLMKIRRRLWT